MSGIHNKRFSARWGGGLTAALTRKKQTRRGRGERAVQENVSHNGGSVWIYGKVFSVVAALCVASVSRTAKLCGERSLNFHRSLFWPLFVCKEKIKSQKAGKYVLNQAEVKWL